MPATRAKRSLGLGQNRENSSRRLQELVPAHRYGTQDSQLEAGCHNIDIDLGTDNMSGLRYLLLKREKTEVHLHFRSGGSLELTMSGQVTSGHADF